MAALSITQPFPRFHDVDGDPLESGYVRIGVAGLDPESNPVTVYTSIDALGNLSNPIVQPIRTIGGAPVYNGSPTQLYVDAEDYSVSVRNKNGSFLYAKLESGLAIPFSAASGGIPSSNIKAVGFTLQFDDLAAAEAGTPISGATIDWADYVGQMVSTVYKTSASKANGATYIVKTDSQVASDGDATDGTGAPLYSGDNHQVAPGYYLVLHKSNNYNALVAKDTSQDAEIAALEAAAATRQGELNAVIEKNEEQDTAIGLLSTGVSIVYNDKATMDADTGQPTNTLAVVWNDSPNNGIYGYNGSAWVLSDLYDYSTFDSRQDADEANLAKTNRFSLATTNLGYPAVDGTAATTGNTRFNTITMQKGVLIEIKIYVKTAGTFQFKLFRRLQDGTWGATNLFSKALTAGVQTITTDIPDDTLVGDTDYLGYYSAAGEAAFAVGSSGDSYSYVGDGVGINTYSASTARLAINATVYTNNSEVEGVLDDTAGLEKFGNNLVANLTATAGNTRVVDSGAPADNVVLKSVDVNIITAGDGTGSLKVLRLETGSTYRVVYTQAVTGMVAGVNNIAISSRLILESGDLVGLYTNNATIGYRDDGTNDFTYNGDLIGGFILSDSANNEWCISANYVKAGSLRDISEYSRAYIDNNKADLDSLSSLAQFGNSLEYLVVSSAGNTRVVDSGAPADNVVLKSVDVIISTVGDTTCSLKVLRLVSGTTYDVVYNEDFSGLVVGLNTLELTTQQLLLAGDLVGIYTTDATISYRNDGTNDLSVFGNASGQVTLNNSAGNEWCISANYYTAAGLRNKIEGTKLRVDALESGTTLSQSLINFNALLKNRTVYSTDFNGTSIPEGWTSNGAWTFNDQAESPGAGSWTTWLSRNSFSSVDKRVISAIVKIDSATSIFSIVTRGSGISGSIGEVDCSAGLLRLYQEWDDSDPPSVASTQAIGFSITAGRLYQVTLEKGIENTSGSVWEMFHEVTLTDLVTQDTISLRDYYPDGGSGWGYPGVVFRQGDVKIKRFSLTNGMPRNPKVSIYGDSITEGNTIFQARNDRWAQLVSDALSGDVFISGRGGATSTDLVARLASDFDPIYPTYVILAIGTNDSVLATWQANIEGLIAQVEAKGATPILCTMPPRADRQSFLNSANTYVRGSGYRYVDFAYALTDSNDGVTWNASYDFGDGIHPNEAGHAAMFAQLQADVPELFV